jgi:hypothetical protein
MEDKPVAIFALFKGKNRIFMGHAKACVEYAKKLPAGTIKSIELRKLIIRFPPGMESLARDPKWELVLKGEKILLAEKVWEAIDGDRSEV